VPRLLTTTRLFFRRALSSFALRGFCCIGLSKRAFNRLLQRGLIPFDLQNLVTTARNNLGGTAFRKYCGSLATHRVD